MVIRPSRKERRYKRMLCVYVCVVSRLQMSECVRATFWTRRWTRKCKDECKNVFIIFLRWLYSCIRHEKYFKFVSRHKLLKLQFNSQVHSLYLFFSFSTFLNEVHFLKSFWKFIFFECTTACEGQIMNVLFGMEFQCLVFCTWKKMEMKFEVICISKEEKFKNTSDINSNAVVGALNSKSILEFYRNKDDLPASRIGWLSLYQTISVFGFESSAVQASSIKLPAITGVGCLRVTLLGGTENRYFEI